MGYYFEISSKIQRSARQRLPSCFNTLSWGREGFVCPPQQKHDLRSTSDAMNQGICGPSINLVSQHILFFGRIDRHIVQISVTKLSMLQNKHWTECLSKFRNTVFPQYVVYSRYVLNASNCDSLMLRMIIARETNCKIRWIPCGIRCSDVYVDWRHQSIRIHGSQWVL